MTFQLSPKDLDRIGAVPLYRQLADRIQQAIEEGELKPGDPLPSEAETEKALRVSRTVIREAMDELLRDGLVVKRKGAPTRVAEPPRRRRMDTSRYLAELAILDKGGEHPKTNAFVNEYDAKWESYTVDADYRREKATPADAELLGVKAGSPIMRRHFVKYVDEEPVQVQRSAVPWDIAKGTVLADPDAQPYPGGTIAELFAAGHRATRVVEEAWARMPTGDERRALQLATVGPVWDIVRVFYAGERAVEASRVVCPTATNVLAYETDLRS